ncbi:Metallo-dependent phosphatase-like protein [Terfezia claveryi]|nr:Metallo-dependent phosphatase-like protein [Terfezia claveryi]
MENYQKSYGQQPGISLPPAPTYDSLPIHGEERKPRPETDQTSQAESSSRRSGKDKKIAKEKLKDEVCEKREGLRNQKDITPHMSTSSSLTGVAEGGPHHHDGQESLMSTWSQKHKKRVRIVCISDTHNQTPARLPPGDILIHAGDLTNSGTYKELSRAAEWLKNLKGYEYKIVVPGNHDLGLDRSWVEDFGYEIGVGLKEEECLGEGKRTWEDCVELFLGKEARDRGVVYIGPDYNHSGGRGRDSDSKGIRETEGLGDVEVRIPGKMKELRLSNGVKFTVWGCPAIPIIMRPDLSEQEVSTRFTNPTTSCTRPKRRWAFGYSTPVSLDESCWADIPASGIDILVTHTPPKYHLDSHDSSSLPISSASSGGSSIVQNGLERAKFFGCEFLRQALWRTKPRLHVFGHVHEGRGAQVVRWDADSGRVVEWVDPGGSKMSLVDLTGRNMRGAQDWKVVDEGKGLGGEAETGNSQPGIASDETSGHTPIAHQIEHPRPQHQPSQPAFKPPMLPVPDTPPPSMHAPTHSSILPNIQPSTQPMVCKTRSSQTQSLSPPSLSHHDFPPLMSTSPHTQHSHQPSSHSPKESSVTTVTSAPTPAPALLPGQETCLVNASYVTSSYYTRRAVHTAANRAASVAGGSRKVNVVNKPIVVDFELEVEAGWLEEKEREEMRRDEGARRGRGGS